MDLIFPLQSQYISSKPKNGSSPSLTTAPSLRGSIQTCRLSRVKPKKIRVRSEFDGKVNGALSADFDPRFLDRVSNHNHFSAYCMFLENGVFWFSSLVSSC